MIKPPRALVSLLRDSKEPRVRAHKLVRRLRQDGIDAEIGEFDPARWVQSPSRIIFVCTPATKNAPYQLTLDFDSIALRIARQQREIIAVSFSEHDVVPDQLSSSPRYQLWRDYDGLVTHIRSPHRTRAHSERPNYSRIVPRGTQVLVRDARIDGRYQLIEHLGDGGFAEVWKARDFETDQFIALKCLHAQWSRDPSRLARFLAGVRRMQQLDHPAIARVLDEPAGLGERYFYTMTWYVGGNLRDAITQNRITSEQGLRALESALAGLTYAHQHGVIHRDVKPENILLDKYQRGVIADFDLARTVNSTQGTRTGAGLGSVLYAAPEALIDARGVDFRADVYGAGLCVIFVLTQSDPPPFVALAQPEYIDQLPCDDGLRAAIHGAVAYSPSERTTSIPHLISAIHAFLCGTVTEPSPRTPTPTDDADPMLDFHRLQHFLLTNVSGVKLVLARYQHLRVARFFRALIAETTRKHGVPLAEVDFASEGDRVDILARLVDANANANVLFVVGLDHLLLDDGTHPHATDAITQFNFNRDLIAERVSGVVVFWLSERATKAFARLAQDTLDVFVTSFELPSAPPSFRSKMSVADLRPEWMVALGTDSEAIEQMQLLWLELDSTDPTKHELAGTIAKALYACQDRGAALQWFGHAVDQAEHVGDALASARFRCSRAWIAAMNDDWERATAELDEAELLTRQRSRAGLFEIQLQRAEFSYLQDDIALALATLERLLSEAADDSQKLVVVARICDCLRRKGDFAASLHTIEHDLLDLAKKVGSPRAVAQAYQSKALTLACGQDFDEALHVLHEYALPYFEHADDNLGFASTKMIIADILYALGDYDSGLEILRDNVLPVYKDTMMVREIWRVHSAISSFEQAIADVRRAEEEVRNALTST